jgi:hypothetical protein
MIPLLLWTTGCGTTSNLTDGNALPESSQWRQVFRQGAQIALNLRESAENVSDLTDHHTLGVKTTHGHTALHTARQGTLTERNAAALSRNMTITHLDQLRVERYFIRKMCPSSQCEDASYHEEDVSDWVACCRDTMYGTIGECFLVTAEQVKLDLRCVLKHTVLTLVHVNADLWTSKVSHQKFLDVSICWKADTDLKTTLLEVTL